MWDQLSRWNWQLILDFARTVVTMGGVVWAAVSFYKGNKLAKERDENNNRWTEQREKTSHSRNLEREVLNEKRENAKEMITFLLAISESCNTEVIDAIRRTVSDSPTAEQRNQAVAAVVRISEEVRKAVLKSQTIQALYFPEWKDDFEKCLEASLVVVTVAVKGVGLNKASFDDATFKSANESFRACVATVTERCRELIKDHSKYDPALPDTQNL